VTSGYVREEGRRDLFAVMDAANVDLKGFTDEFYVRLTGGRLRPVLDTLVYLRHETQVWLEITTLVIPGWNDSEDELRAMFRWVVAELGPDVPHHVTAFHPDHRMRDVPPTPLATLRRARDIARDAGLHYVYTGNVTWRDGEVTSCVGCGRPLIERDRYAIRRYRLTPQGRCEACGTALPGRFAEAADTFGPHRIPVTLGH
jgi:pyruvate formate lyase activating enzyme